MDKKIILVGSINEIESYSSKLNLYEIRTKQELDAFIKSDFLFGCCHGNSCETIKEILELDESQVSLIDLKIFSSLEKYCPIEEKKLFKFLNTKFISIKNPIELDLERGFKIDLFEDNKTLPTIENFKLEAKRIKKNNKNIKNLGHAQNKLAQRFGFKDYNAIKPNLFSLENFLRKSRCMSSPTMLGYSDCSNLSETINDTPIKLTIGDAQNSNTSMKSFIISSELKGNTFMNIIGVVGTGKTTYLKEMANALKEYNCKYLLVDTINNFYDIRKELYDIEDFYKQIECDIEEQNPKWVLIDHFDVFSTHSKEKTFQESSDKFISFLNKKKICLIVVSCKSAFEYRNDFEIVKIERN